MLRIDQRMRLVDNRHEILVVARAVAEWLAERLERLQVLAPVLGVPKELFAMLLA